MTEADIPLSVSITCVNWDTVKCVFSSFRKHNLVIQQVITYDILSCTLCNDGRNSIHMIPVVSDSNQLFKPPATRIPLSVILSRCLSCRTNPEDEESARVRLGGYTETSSQLLEQSVIYMSEAGNLPEFGDPKCCSLRPVDFKSLTDSCGTI